MKLIFLSLFVLLSCAKEVRLIPMTDFFKNPVKTGYRISPDGKHLSFLKPWENRLNVYVQKIGEKKELRITNSEERDIAGSFWANNNRIIFFQDKGGDENYHVYGVNLDGSQNIDLTPFKKTKAQIVNQLENIDDEMLISMNKRDKKVFDVYRININSGKMEMVFKNPGNASGYRADWDGKLRVYSVTDGVNNTVYYRESELHPFIKIMSTGFRDSFSPILFTSDSKSLIVRSNIGRDKEAFYEFDPRKKKFGKIVFESKEVDVENLFHSPKKRVVTAATYYTHKRQYHFIDEERGELQKKIDSKLEEENFDIISRSKDERKMLIKSYSDRTKGAYYYFDWDKDNLIKLEEISPWINKNEMAKMKPIKYQSRDGLTIHGYLTLPIGKKGKLPVVVFPHGGPWARDFWGYSSTTQFLANRGYAVLKINFRGSTGYGKKFWEASFKQWGKKMQDDITDGVKWIIGEGIADEKRIGIFGASYGGYATLAGLTFTPDLYACGVDYVGVSNLFTFMETIPPYWSIYKEMLYEMVGHPIKDKELLRSGSPALNAEKIKAPLFIAQGANDPRVVKSESDQMVAILKKRGIEVPYMVKDNEGHGFRNEENRFDFNRAMEKFLAKHLKGRSE